MISFFVLFFRPRYTFDLTLLPPPEKVGGTRKSGTMASVGCDEKSADEPRATRIETTIRGRDSLLPIVQRGPLTLSSPAVAVILARSGELLAQR